MTLEMVKAVACIVNMITIVIDDSKNITIINDVLWMALQIVVSLKVHKWWLYQHLLLLRDIWWLKVLSIFKCYSFFQRQS
jgi:hypothetical protein